MPNSETDICNLALAHLGEAPIVSLLDDSTSGRACNLHYSTTRDAMLRAHRWNFAQARATLSALATAPAFEWGYEYPLPTDCVRVLEFNGTEAGDAISSEFIIEGRSILSDDSTVEIVYIQRMTDVSQFDSLFVEAFALALAIKLSESIRGTTGKTAELEAGLQRTVMPLARRIDANEGRRRRGLLPLNSLFVRAREGI